MWIIVAVAAWAFVSVPLALLAGRMLALTAPPVANGNRILQLVPRPAATRSRAEGEQPTAPHRESPVAPALEQRQLILVVDDDPALRLLLRTTLAADEFAVEEASSAEEGAQVARFRRPTLVVLDVGLPGMSGLEFCRDLKRNTIFGCPRVILLTGADTGADEARAAGADALLRKPFSPLELVELIDRLPHGDRTDSADATDTDADQLLVYARDLNRVLQIERTQRRLVQHAYRQTATALADALEAKDGLTGTHARRVQRYALELTRTVDQSLLDDPSLEFGYLLHDIGKIAIPDSILNKHGALDAHELRLLQQHPLIGAELLGGVALLEGEGIHVVRSHHERWDGRGYPAGLADEQIPIGARIFAVADALDAMTSDRPYRDQLSWGQAVDQILAEDGSQFDPHVVTAFAVSEPHLKQIHEQFALYVT